MTRIDSLDWQRGLLAFAIMLYHLTGWQIAELDSSSLLGRLGIYGVSMFFVLSGLSMAIVYHKYLDGAQTSIHFFLRRIFRIWPLLWLAIFFSVAASTSAGAGPSWRLVAINLTTAFGFINPSLYINTGAWSIGNEMVYYALTPLIIYAFNKRLVFGNLLTGATILLGIVFSFHILRTDESLAAQWAHYINPFNNLFLYCAGIAIYYNTCSWQFSKMQSLLCFAAPIALFVLFPARGDQVTIVTGLGRIVFCFASVALVLAFYKNVFMIPQAISVPLTHLGVLTYGMYLLHPIVYQSTLLAWKQLHLDIGPYGVIAVTISVTLLVAQASFKMLEAPFIRIGKKLTTGPRAVESRTAEAPVQSGNAV